MKTSVTAKPSSGVAENVLSTIGNTPLVKLKKVTEGVQAAVLAKV
jgi:cystathionine beta-synthase